MNDINDSDLPDFMFTGVTPKPRDIDPVAAAKIAAQVHYPALEAKAKRREQRSQVAERKAALDEAPGRKKYIKMTKRLQMYEWLYALLSAQCRNRLEVGEASFCMQLMARFQKYSVQRTKWLTQAQYEWLNSIAAKYLIKVRNDK